MAVKRILIVMAAAVILTGCGDMAGDLTGAIQTSADARLASAEATLTQADAERIREQAVADTQRAYAAQLALEHERYAAAQEARIAEAQRREMVATALMLTFGLIGVALVVLAIVALSRRPVTHTVYQLPAQAQYQTYSPVGIGEPDEWPEARARQRALAARCGRRDERYTYGR